MCVEMPFKETRSAPLRIHTFVKFYNALYTFLENIHENSKVDYINNMSLSILRFKDSNKFPEALYTFFSEFFAHEAVNDGVEGHTEEI